MGPMALPIEEYALVGDTETAALVGSDGSIDWLCLPRFDSPAVFAALLGDGGNGHWTVAPVGGLRRTTRRYIPDTLVLESTFHADDGVVRVIDFMPPRGRTADLVRVVEGVEGRVPMRMDLVLRFDYGSTVPWVRRADGSLTAIAGPEAVYLRTPVATRGAGMTTVADFVVAPGDRVPFVLAWHPSHVTAPDSVDAERALRSTVRWWRKWVRASTYEGDWRDEVVRSLITLKALTYAPTGGIVAAPTTSLPEKIGGVRNWDYRYCWLRDATFTLYSLLAAGYEAEATAWRDWLLRAAAGNPSALQIMYGVRGERRLEESSLPWLPGYMGSSPVRVGNAAHQQFQLDVYGEVIDSLHQTRRVSAPDPSGTPGRSRPRSSSSWRAPGRTPTKASGRSAGRASTSPTRRSWPGWPSTGRCAASRSSGSTGRSSDGRASATRSTSRSAPRATTPRWGRSRRPTALAGSTPRCS